MVEVYGLGIQAEHSSEVIPLRPVQPVEDSSLRWIRKLLLNNEGREYTAAEWCPGRRRLRDRWQPIRFGDHDESTAEDTTELRYSYVESPVS